MKKSLIVLVALVMGAFQYAQAQYVQGRPATEYMFKIEAGYMPFVTNIFEKAESGYILANQEHAAGLNIMNGWNISQDFFLGFGVGYACLSPLNDFSKMSHNALAFVDFDFRPLQDEFAPMIGARIGGSAMIPTGKKVGIIFDLKCNAHNTGIIADINRNINCFSGITIVISAVNICA